MKTLVLFASKHGACEKIANELSDVATTICNLHDFDLSTITNYEQIVIGSSIYVGKLDENMCKFLKEQTSLLLQKSLYIFLSGLEDDPEKINTIFQQNIPSSLLKHATYKGCLGGCLDFKKMNFFEKGVMKLINKKAHFYDVSKKVTYVDILNYHEIQTLKNLLIK